VNSWHCHQLEYQKMKSLVPHSKRYVLKVEDDIYIDGIVERDNVAGFINNSIGREEIGNVVWEYSMLPKPWKQERMRFCYDNCIKGHRSRRRVVCTLLCELNS
jgi:hypothetical protein